MTSPPTRPTHQPRPQPTPRQPPTESTLEQAWHLKDELHRTPGNIRKVLLDLFPILNLPKVKDVGCLFVEYLDDGTYGRVYYTNRKTPPSFNRQNEMDRESACTPVTWLHRPERPGIFYDDE